MLVGPSGCGKSTALRMIAGLETISGGTMRIGDRVVNDVEPKDRDIAMVFQNYALYPHMTVYDNIGFALKLAKVPKERDRHPGAQGRRDPRTRGQPGPQARTVVGWPAPTRRHGSRDRSPARSVPDGRAALEPRRQAARADAGRDRLAPARTGRHDGLRHARPDRGHDDGGPGGGPEGRLPPAGRHPAEPVRPPGQRVRRSVHRFAVDEPVRSRPPPERRGRHDHARLARGGVAVRVPRQGPTPARLRRSSGHHRDPSGGLRRRSVRPAGSRVAADHLHRVADRGTRIGDSWCTSTSMHPPSTPAIPMPSRTRRAAASPTRSAGSTHGRRHASVDQIEVAISAENMHFFDLETRQTIEG